MSDTGLFVILVVIIVLFLHFVFFPWTSKGEMGEKIVAKRLKRLPKDKYRVINDLLLQNNGYSSQIDHVVVSEYGVFVIETKNYQGDIYGGANSEMWTQNIYGNKSQFRNPIWQNKGHITAIRNVLGNPTRIPFENIVLFADGSNLKLDKSLPVYNWRKVIPIIKGFTDVERIPTDVADRIYNKLLAANVRDRKARKEHITSARATKKRRDEAVANGMCPKCGGQLVIREGKYGKFYGCSNYPQCVYTLNIK